MIQLGLPTRVGGRRLEHNISIMFLLIGGGIEIPIGIHRLVDARYRLSCLTQTRRCLFEPNVIYGLPV